MYRAARACAGAVAPAHLSGRLWCTAPHETRLAEWRLGHASLCSLGVEGRGGGVGGDGIIHHRHAPITISASRLHDRRLITMSTCNRMLPFWLKRRREFAAALGSAPSV